MKVRGNTVGTTMKRPDLSSLGGEIGLTLDKDYKLTVTLSNSKGETISSSMVDLPLESFVVGASVSADGSKLIISLQNGQTVSVSVANIVKGLATKAYVDNKVGEINDDLFIRVNTGKLTLDEAHNLTLTLYNKELIKLSESGVELPFGAIIERIGALEERPISADNSTEGLAYELSADGTYYICTGIGTATNTDIVIANEYKGLPVKKIAENAFNSDWSIKKVYIPENIDEIGYGAFRFVNCKIVFAENSKIENIDNGVLDNSLDGCIIFPKSIKRIGSQWGDPVAYPTSLIFKGTPSYISEYLVSDGSTPSQYITDIYVPWAEGKVANAPWGCINATIHYQSPLCEAVTMDGFVGFEYVENIKADVENIKAQIGDIDTALDAILAKQSEVLGGAE